MSCSGLSGPYFRAEESPSIGSSSTWAVPALMNPSFLAAASLRLMMRLVLSGNRSTIRTSTVCPLPRSLTLTQEPSGNLGCPATSSSLLSRIPLAVNPPFALEEKKQAMPVSFELSVPARERSDSDFRGAFAWSALVLRDDGPDFSARVGAKAGRTGLRGTGDGLSVACCAAAVMAKIHTAIANSILHKYLFCRRSTLMWIGMIGERSPDCNSIRGFTRPRAPVQRANSFEVQNRR